jgi:hypothetical protein
LRAQRVWALFVLHEEILQLIHIAARAAAHAAAVDAE